MDYGKMKEKDQLRVGKFHLALFDRLYITERDDGIPGVNPKRPYGNSNVLEDLREIYVESNDFEIITMEGGGILVLDGDRVVSREHSDAGDELERKLWRYHGQMTSILQIVVSTRGISEGLYEKLDRHSNKWRRAEQ